MPFWCSIKDEKLFFEIIVHCALQLKKSGLLLQLDKLFPAAPAHTENDQNRG